MRDLYQETVFAKTIVYAKKYTQICVNVELLLQWENFSRSSLFMGHDDCKTSLEKLKESLKDHNYTNKLMRVSMDVPASIGNN